MFTKHEKSINLKYSDTRDKQNRRQEITHLENKCKANSQTEMFPKHRKQTQ